ncbi:uncharacterized protein LOC111356214 [Spodoptera litura]|uniref:Uncharacterized protein LOC111356214 n=1 Tax=Spodoptera litura TaxID=69820 RepID=A0A9J7IWX5_SPOLT|nr:uncharacterized protein LOC111356214 [Spodoptera litura]
MLQYVVPFIFVLSSATSWQDASPYRYTSPFKKVHAASESQIKFAIENKYDDTGPGAKQPEYAYSTYKNLEDALIAYLDDPDTKLPQHERNKAIHKLMQSQFYTGNAPLTKSENYKLQNYINKNQFKPLNHDFNLYKPHANKLFFSDEDKTRPTDFEVQTLKAEKKPEPFKFQKIHTVKGSPLSLAHYTRDPDLKVAYDQFDSHPKYTYSYGVHDKQTGDSKTVQESRDGGIVTGYYSFIDADGKTRTVHYTADDKLGFRAKVQKTN